MSCCNPAKGDTAVVRVTLRTPSMFAAVSLVILGLLLSLLQAISITVHGEASRDLRCDLRSSLGVLDQRAILRCDELAPLALYRDNNLSISPTLYNAIAAECTDSTTFSQTTYVIFSVFIVASYLVIVGVQTWAAHSIADELTVRKRITHVNVVALGQLTGSIVVQLAVCAAFQVLIAVFKQLDLNIPETIAGVCVRSGDTEVYRTLPIAIAAYLVIFWAFLFVMFLIERVVRNRRLRQLLAALNVAAHYETEEQRKRLALVHYKAEPLYRALREPSSPYAFNLTYGDLAVFRKSDIEMPDAAGATAGVALDVTANDAEDSDE